MIEPKFNIQENVSLSSLTSIGLGGPARYYCVCRNTAAIKSSLAFAAKKKLPVMVIGGGSNLIFSDRGFDGLVIIPRLTNRDRGPSGEISAGAGIAWDNFVRYTLANKLGGLETLSGIPGSVGAVPVQNVGAYGTEVSELITSVSALDRRTGKNCVIANRDCDFSYRTSRFKTRDKGRYIITGVSFRLFPPEHTSPLNYPPLREALSGFFPLAPGPTGWNLVREKVLSLRRQKSMVINASDPHSRSCGSFFVNPLFTPGEFARFEKKAVMFALPPIPSFSAQGKIKVPAAWIIEQAGFPKGYRQGQAGVSPHHNLALVNYGGTTQELLSLARRIHSAVKGKFGLDLAIEPEIIP